MSHGCTLAYNSCIAPKAGTLKGVKTMDKGLNLINAMNALTIVVVLFMLFDYCSPVTILEMSVYSFLYGSAVLQIE